MIGIANLTPPISWYRRYMKSALRFTVPLLVFAGVLRVSANEWRQVFFGAGSGQYIPGTLAVFSLATVIAGLWLYAVCKSHSEDAARDREIQRLIITKIQRS